MEERKDHSNIKKQSKQFIKYSALGTQMLVIIVAGVLLGEFLDNKFNGQGLYLSIVVLFFVIAAIYIGIKDLIHSNEKD